MIVDVARLSTRRLLSVLDHPTTFTTVRIATTRWSRADADLSPPVAVDTSLYDLLGVHPEATEGETLVRSYVSRSTLISYPDEIKKAYRKKVRTPAHP